MFESIQSPSYSFSIDNPQTIGEVSFTQTAHQATTRSSLSGSSEKRGGFISALCRGVVNIFSWILSKIFYIVTCGQCSNCQVESISNEKIAEETKEGKEPFLKHKEEFNEDDTATIFGQWFLVAFGKELTDRTTWGQHALPIESQFKEFAKIKYEDFIKVGKGQLVAGSDLRAIGIHDDVAYFIGLESAKDCPLFLEKLVENRIEEINSKAEDRSVSRELKELLITLKKQKDSPSPKPQELLNEIRAADYRASIKLLKEYIDAQLKNK